MAAHERVLGLPGAHQRPPQQRAEGRDAFVADLQLVLGQRGAHVGAISSR
jgi:hypothetical protein